MAFEKCERGVWLVNHEKKTIISPPCNLKSCEKCAKRKKKVIVLRIMQMMDDRQNTHKFWFWTLTPHGSAIWGEWSEKNMASGWSRLRKRLNRQLKNEIFWVMTKEYTTGSGRYTKAPPFMHYHVIIGYHTSNDPILTTELKRLCAECGIGYMARVGGKKSKDLPIKDVKYAWYVAKYATKNYTAYKMRRAIAWSRNVRELGDAPPKSDGWQFLNMTDRGIRIYANTMKYSVRALDSQEGAISGIIPLDNN